MNIQRYRFTLFIYLLCLSSYPAICLSAGIDINRNITADNIKTSQFIRKYQQGDIFNYASTVTSADTVSSILLKQSIGTIVTNPSGKTCIEHTLSATFPGPKSIAPIDVRLLYFQDSNNSIYECGFYDEKKSAYVFINDTKNTPDAVAMILESPMLLGNTTSSLISYSDGTWKDCTRIVQAIEIIATHTGNFETYKIVENCTNNQTDSHTSSTIWFAPAVSVIQESGTGELISGNFILESFILK